MPILGRFSDFIKSAPSTGSGGKNRDEAIQAYLSTGGILKFDRGVDGASRILYPDRQRIMHQLEGLGKKKDYILSQVSLWENSYKRHNENSTAKIFQRVSDPLYWEHLVRMGVDADYRNAVRVIDPPVKMMRDKKWRKQMTLFVRNGDYRDRLLEARTSALGRHRDSMRHSAEKAQGFEREVIENRLNKLKKELENYEEKEGALRGLLEWID
jgi:hypothetical protein